MEHYNFYRIFLLLILYFLDFRSDPDEDPDSVDPHQLDPDPHHCLCGPLIKLNQSNDQLKYWTV